MKYKLTTYNEGKTINENGDNPIKPNGIIGSISFESEEESRVYLDVWKAVAKQNSILYRQRIELTYGDTILETYENYVR